MFYKKQEKHIWVFQLWEIAFKFLNIHFSALVFSVEYDYIYIDFSLFYKQV